MNVSPVGLSCSPRQAGFPSAVAISSVTGLQASRKFIYSSASLGGTLGQSISLPRDGLKLSHPTFYSASHFTSQAKTLPATLPFILHQPVLKPSDFQLGLSARGTQFLSGEVEEHAAPTRLPWNLVCSGRTTRKPKGSGYSEKDQCSRSFMSDFSQKAFLLPFSLTLQKLVAQGPRITYPVAQEPWVTMRHRLIRFPGPGKPASKASLQHTWSTLTAGSKDPTATARAKRYTCSKQLGLATAPSEKQFIM